MGVFSENGRDRVFSEILKLIKLFWSLRGWRDQNIYCYDHPAQDDIVGNAGGCYDTLAQKINEIKESELALSSAGA